MTLGPNTKAAIRRIVDLLPYLHADGAALPTGMSDRLSPIRTRAAALPSSGTRDPRFQGANDWAEQELSDALDADEAEGEKAKADEPEPDLTVLPPPADPTTDSITQDGTDSLPPTA